MDDGARGRETMKERCGMRARHGMRDEGVAVVRGAFASGASEGRGGLHAHRLILAGACQWSIKYRSRIKSGLSMSSVSV
eukprot:scaffold10121_cov112-Isochrysis_galbana.AAC.1